MFMELNIISDTTKITKVWVNLLFTRLAPVSPINFNSGHGLEFNPTSNEKRLWEKCLGCHFLNFLRKLAIKIMICALTQTG